MTDRSLPYSRPLQERRSSADVAVALMIVAGLVVVAMTFLQSRPELSVATAPPLAPRPRPALPAGVAIRLGDKSASGAHRVTPVRADPARAWVASNLGPTLSCLADDDTVLAWGSRARLNALDAATGKLRWQTKISRVGPPDPPVIAGDEVLVGGMSAPLRALSLETGAERWRAHTDGVYLPQLIDDERVWIGSGFSLLAIARSDGRVLQRFDPNHAALYTGVIEPYPGRAAAGVLHDRVWTFDTRGPEWDSGVNLEGGQNTQITAHVADDKGRVFAMNASGDLRAFADNGATRWSTPGPQAGSCWQLLVFEDMVVRVCEQLDAFALDDGQMRFSVPGGASRFVSAAVVGDSLFALQLRALAFIDRHGEMTTAPLTFAAPNADADAICVAHGRVYVATSTGAIEAWM